jgi:hypothetical protein
MKSGIQIFEEDSQILERIARQYAADSKEYAALAHAGLALLYVLKKGDEKFMQHMVAPESGLTAEQRAHLIGMKIDPDSEL